MLATKSEAEMNEGMYSCNGTNILTSLLTVKTIFSISSKNARIPHLQTGAYGIRG